MRFRKLLQALAVCLIALLVLPATSGCAGKGGGYFSGVGE